MAVPWALIGTGAGILSSIFGGSSGGNSAEEAARIQVEFQREALDYMKQTQRTPLHYRDYAMGMLGGLYGIPGYTPAEPAPSDNTNIPNVPNFTPDQINSFTPSPMNGGIPDGINFDGSFVPGAPDTLMASMPGSMDMGSRSPVAIGQASAGLPLIQSARPMGGLQQIPLDGYFDLPPVTGPGNSYTQPTAQSSADAYSPTSTDYPSPMISPYTDRAGFIEGLRTDPFYELILNQMEEGVRSNAAMTGGFRSGSMQNNLARANEEAMLRMYGMRMNEFNQFEGGLQSMAGYPVNSAAVANQQNLMGQTTAQGMMAASDARRTGWTDALNMGLDYFSKAYQPDGSWKWI